MQPAATDGVKRPPCSPRERPRLFKHPHVFCALSFSPVTGTPLAGIVQPVFLSDAGSTLTAPTRKPSESQRSSKTSGLLSLAALDFYPSSKGRIFPFHSVMNASLLSRLLHQLLIFVVMGTLGGLTNRVLGANPEDQVEVHANLPYAGTSNAFQMLDLYLPKMRAKDQPLPVVVFVHGGGWVGGNRKFFASKATQLAATGCFAAVSIGYRLSKEATWPAQIYDCKAAIRWIRGHAKEFGLDTEHIGAIGGSAGGHLVTMLGVSGGVKALEGDLGEFTSLSSRVTCVVNVCGPTDLTTALIPGSTTDDPLVRNLIGGELRHKMDVAIAASPLTYVTAHAVPVMTIHGTRDLRVSFTNAEKLDAALKKVGATSLLIPVKDGSHSIGLSTDLGARVRLFWDMHLRGIPSEIETTPVPAAAAKN